MVMSALCRDEFDEASDAAGRLLAHAEVTRDASLRMESHYLLGISAFWAAHLDTARDHFETVITEFDRSVAAQHHEVYGHDPHVVCLSRLANTLWFLGREDDARRTCDDALALADEVGHALSHDTAAIFSCLLSVDLDDRALLRHFVTRLGAVESLPFATKHEAFFGLVDVLDGKQAEGVARVRAAFERCEGRNFYPGFQAAVSRVLAAAQLHAGDVGGGLDTCARGLALGSTPLWEAELHRIRAELLHTEGATADQVEGALRAADAVARRQGAGGHLRRVQATCHRLGLKVSPTPA
jgi:hypothetical protein